jgi:hypothetical protein
MKEAVVPHNVLTFHVGTDHMTVTGQEPYAAALAAIERFRQRIAPTGEQERRLAEIERRLLRLSANFHRLMEINRELTDQDFSEVYFDAEADMLEFSAGGRMRRLKLKRDIQTSRSSSAASSTCGYMVPARTTRARMRV